MNSNVVVISQTTRDLRYIKYNIKLVRFVNPAEHVRRCLNKKGVKLPIPISSAGMGTLTPFCYFSGLGLTDHLNAAFDKLAQCFTFQHTVCQQGKVDQLADQFISTSIFGQDAVALFYQFVNLFVRIRHIFLLFRSDFFFFLLALGFAQVGLAGFSSLSGQKGSDSAFRHKPLLLRSGFS